MSNQDKFDRIKSLSRELQQVLMQIGSAVYTHAGNSNRSGREASSGRGEDVIDADFVENI